jgi:uncharacterized Fe-S radical SAM superfamily protein PflX
MEGNPYLRSGEDLGTEEIENPAGGGEVKTVQPGYLSLYQTGELSKRIMASWKKLECCDICPHKCSVNRLKDEKGICKTGRKLKFQAMDRTSERKVLWWADMVRARYF